MANAGPHHQHYIPQFLLRNFWDGGKVWVYATEAKAIVHKGGGRPGCHKFVLRDIHGRLNRTIRRRSLFDEVDLLQKTRLEGTMPPLIFMNTIERLQADYDERVVHGLFHPAFGQQTALRPKPGQDPVQSYKPGRFVIELLAHFRTNAAPSLRSGFHYLRVDHLYDDGQIVGQMSFLRPGTMTGAAWVSLLREGAGGSGFSRCVFRRK